MAFCLNSSKTMLVLKDLRRVQLDVNYILFSIDLLLCEQKALI